MNPTIIFVAVALFFIISGLINFIGSLDEEVDKKSNYSTKTQEHYGQNIMGERTLLLSNLSAVEKRKAWNDSSIKLEMMQLFPNFQNMHKAVNEYVVDGGDFKKKLLEKIEELEGDYISGGITSEQVKSTLLAL